MLHRRSVQVAMAISAIQIESHNTLRTLSVMMKNSQRFYLQSICILPVSFYHPYYYITEYARAYPVTSYSRAISEYQSLQSHVVGLP